MKPLCYLLLPFLLVALGCKTRPLQPDLVDIRKFTPPAERGDAWGQYQLGQAYASHWIYPNANIWYRKAALQGEADAMYALGESYLNGLGVPKNLNEAYAWFAVASTQKQIAARNARESLASRMSHTEIDDGDRRAAALLREIPPGQLLYAQFETPTNPETDRRVNTIRAATYSGGAIGAVIGITAEHMVRRSAEKNYYAPNNSDQLMQPSHYQAIPKGGTKQASLADEEPDYSPLVPAQSASQHKDPVFQPVPAAKK